ncbi:MAG TPA: hypothetical protein VK002_13510, partial [Rubricoccaceae bacterium]|nr:hypothetical protein [Rubricoccaceae bacterium]
MRRSILLALLLGPALAAQPLPEVEPAPLVVGETFTLPSAVLGETRRINVYAPAAYAESDTLRL